MERRTSGYTLIELLIVMAIIAILVTIGYLNFQDYSRHQALISAARSIQVNIRQAEEYAAAGKKPSGCLTLLNGYQFKVTSQTTYEIDAICTPNSFYIINQPFTMPLGMTIAAPNPNPVIFKSLAQGTNIGSGGTASIVITQTVSGNTKTVTIGANGDVQ